MGVDIESFAQIFKQDSWQTIATSINQNFRNYKFFNALGMTGRCDHLEVRYELRGLPEGINKVLVDGKMEFHRYEKDGNQIDFPFSNDIEGGWLTLEEMESINDHFESLPCIECYGEGSKYDREENFVRLCPQCKMCAKHAYKEYHEDHDAEQAKHWYLGTLQDVIEELNRLADQYEVTEKKNLRYVFCFNT